MVTSHAKMRAMKAFHAFYSWTIAQNKTFELSVEQLPSISIEITFFLSPRIIPRITNRIESAKELLMKTQLNERHQIT